MYKRIAVILLAVVMLLSAAGCASEEMGMYSLVKEIMQLDVFETSGTVLFSMEGTGTEQIFRDAPQGLQSLKDVLKSGVELKYSAKEKKNPLEYEITVEIRFKGESTYKKLTTISGNEKVAYIKLNDYISFLMPYIVAVEPDAEAVLTEMQSKVEYLEVDLQTGQNKGFYKSGLSNPAKAEQVMKFITGFADIFKEAFSGFNTGAVTKKGDGYELKLDAKALRELILKFLEYLVNNIDRIVDKSTQKIQTTSEEDLQSFSQAMGGIPMEKESMISGLEDIRKEIKNGAAEEIGHLKDDPLFNRGFASIEGSNLTYDVAKAVDGSYRLSTNLNIVYENQWKVSVDDDLTIKKLNSFSMIKPSHAVTLEGLNKIVSPALNLRKQSRVDSMAINLSTGETHLKYGNGKISNFQMSYVSKEGSTYVPLRMIGETFGEEVGWDGSAKTPYVVKNGKRVEMHGLAVNGRTYVKVRDFEKLGYIVFWNQNTKEALIEKPRSVLDTF